MRVPAHPAPDFRIGILGTTPLGATLQQLTAHESLDGRPMRVVEVTSAADARTCDILFLAESEAPRLQHDLSMVEGLSVLTVSRMPGFVEHGGMVQFLVEQNRVRFQVNLSAAERVHIQLSSELLRLAVQVTGEQHEGASR